jgi:tetratricopeptide (TPR) repeat protein
VISERLELADLLEALFENDDCYRFVRAQMYGAPLPEGTIVPDRHELVSFHQLQKLVDALVHDQPTIADVSNAFSAIGFVDDVDAAAKERFREAAISRGVFHEIVVSIKEGAISDRTVFYLYEHMADIPHNRLLLSTWLGPYRAKSHMPLLLQEQDAPPDREHLYHRPLYPSTYQNVVRQQDAIIAKLEEGDLSMARRFAAELVANQVAAGDHNYAAKTMSKLSQFAKSMEYFDLQLEWALAAVDVLPEDSQSHAAVVDAYLQLGRYADALSRLGLAESRDFPTYPATVRGRILRAQRDYKAALKVYQRVNEDYPDDPGAIYAWSGIAECLRDLGRTAEALDTYNDAIKKFPDDMVLRRGRAATLAEVGLLNEAAKAYDDALSYDAGDFIALNGKASLAKLTGSLDEAELLYRDLIRDFPRASYSYAGLADALRLNGKIQEAVEWGKRALQLFPEKLVAYLGYAHALTEAGDFGEAERVWKSAYDAFPEEPDAIIGWAYVQRRRGNYSEALRIYDQLVDKYPQDAYARRAKADMLRRLGRVKESLSMYDSLIEVTQHSIHAKTSKASLLIDQGRLEEAMPLLQESLPVTQEDWRNFIVKGLWLLKKGRPREAQAHLESAAGRCPFAREQRFIGSALTSISILHPAPSVSVAKHEQIYPDITGLIRFHAMALSKRRQQAIEMYRSLQAGLPHQYHGLRDEIAKRYHVIPGKARRQGRWLAIQTTRSLLLEAA